MLYTSKAGRTTQTQKEPATYVPLKLAFPVNMDVRVNVRSSTRWYTHTQIPAIGRRSINQAPCTQKERKRKSKIF